MSDSALEAQHQLLRRPGEQGGGLVSGDQVRQGDIHCWGCRARRSASAAWISHRGSGHAAFSLRNGNTKRFADRFESAGFLDCAQWAHCYHWYRFANSFLTTGTRSTYKRIDGLQADALSSLSVRDQ
jgi:hypothetical protein